MAWKAEKQLSFADPSVVEHEALLERDEINEVIDWPRIEAQLVGYLCQERRRFSVCARANVQSVVAAIVVCVERPDTRETAGSRLIISSICRVEPLSVSARPQHNLALSPSVRQSQSDGKITQRSQRAAPAKRAADPTWER